MNTKPLHNFLLCLWGCPSPLSQPSWESHEVPDETVGPRLPTTYQRSGGYSDHNSREAKAKVALNPECMRVEGVGVPQILGWLPQLSPTVFMVFHPIPFS